MFTWFRRLLGPTKRDLRNLSAILLDQGDEIAAELRELKCKLGQRDLIDEENTVESLTRELLVEKLEAELAEAKAGVNELIENNDRLVKLISDPKLLELELEPGGSGRKLCRLSRGRRELAVRRDRPDTKRSRRDHRHRAKEARQEPRGDSGRTAGGDCRAQGRNHWPETSAVQAGGHRGIPAPLDEWLAKPVSG